MTFADDLKPLLRSVRSLPGVLGIRPHTVAVVSADTDGAYTGDGDRTETITPITHAGGQPPKVRWANDKDVAMGVVPIGQVTVGPITSDDDGVSTLLDLLNGTDLAGGDVRLLRITGPRHPEGCDYRITDVKSERALHYLITAEPVGRQA